ncbi:MAG: hypothetical protein BRD48_00765 [Bacteroidetes bacterium QS_9_68_14]|nr:MAG: hypothetical protein BRD48_00765 [Bacteroidetes bacterium QS_9_68_14]
MLAACDSIDGGDPPEPEPVDVILRPTYAGDLVGSATLHAEGEQVGTGETTLTREQGTSLSVRAKAEGFEDATASVSFDAEHTESIPLMGDSVTVNLRAEGAGSDALLSDATLFADDAEIGMGEAQIIRARSDKELSLRAEAASFDPADTTVTLDESHDVALSLDRKTVTLEIDPELTDSELWPDGDDRDEHEGPVKISINGDSVGTVFIDSRETPNVLEVTHPMSERELTVSGDVRYPGRYVNYAGGILIYRRAQGSLAVSATADNTITLGLEELAACNDGIDNDGTNGLDRADAGCTNSYGKYDPEEDYDPTDDKEILKGVSSQAAGGAADDIYYVSSEEGNRELLQRHYDVPGFVIDQTTQIAVGEILYYFNVKRSSSQSDETFATKWVCDPLDEEGPFTTTMLNVVPDNQKQDGWKVVQNRVLTYEAFATGLECKVYLIHGTKARGEPPGDGEDDVIRASPNEPVKRILAWFWEPEEQAKLSSSQAATTQSVDTRDCRETPAGEVCTEEILDVDELRPPREWAPEK